MKKIIVRGLEVIVDDDDYERLMQFTWRLDGGSTRPYVMRAMYLHKYILGVDDSCIVDHINGNQLDNRKCNLRKSCKTTNNWNMPKRMTRKGVQATSKYKGVMFCPFKGRDRWMAKIAANGVRHKLGYFYNEEDAARAYNEAAKRIHGEFAWLNEIP